MVQVQEHHNTLQDFSAPLSLEEKPGGAKIAKIDFLNPNSQNGAQKDSHNLVDNDALNEGPEHEVKQIYE